MNEKWRLIYEGSGTDFAAIAIELLKLGFDEAEHSNEIIHYFMVSREVRPGTMDWNQIGRLRLRPVEQTIEAADNTAAGP